MIAHSVHVCVSVLANSELALYCLFPSTGTYGVNHFQQGKFSSYYTQCSSSVISVL